MKKVFIMCLLVCLTGKITNAQLYRSMDLESGNVFSLFGGTLIGGLTNMLTGTAVCKNAFLITPISAKAKPNELSVENYKWNLTDANDLFKDIQVGGRIGYISTYGFFNAGFYASLHYRINQFKVEDKVQNAYLKHNVHRIMPGFCALFRLGEVAGINHSSGVLWTIETGLKYAVVTKYENAYNLDKSTLNNGIISHFAVYCSPNSDFCLQDIGLFIDINHYNLIKDAGKQYISDLNMWTLGMQIAISPSQASARARY